MHTLEKWRHAHDFVVIPKKAKSERNKYLACSGTQADFDMTLHAQCRMKGLIAVKIVGALFRERNPDAFCFVRKQLDTLDNFSTGVFDREVVLLA